eukprot:1988516-Prymnesium_polylepis.1
MSLQSIRRKRLSSLPSSVCTCSTDAHNVAFNYPRRTIALRGIVSNAYNAFKSAHKRTIPPPNVGQAPEPLLPRRAPSSDSCRPP